MNDVNRNKLRETVTDQAVLDHLPPPKRASMAAVGLFVILGISATLVVLFTMTEPSAFRSRHVVYTVVGDAGGVRRGDPVQMRGVIIGRVQSFNMLEEDGLVRINLELEQRWDVPLGSTVEVGDPSLFGGRTILITPGPGPGVHEGGDRLPTLGEETGGVFASIEEMSENASVMLDRVSSMLDTATVSSIQAGARELESFLATASSTLRIQGTEIGAMAASVQAAADSVAAMGGAVSPGVEGMIARADTVMAQFGEAADGIDDILATLRSVLAKIDRGEGTLGLLVNDPELYANANAATRAFADLLADFRENPQKYIDVSIF